MHSETAPPAAYNIGGQHWLKDAPGFAETIALAFEKRLRPRCLCRKNSEGQGVEMYVARLLDGYIVKRMPTTGSLHATSCPSYEPPADHTGLGQLLGNAIIEDPITGKTALKLDFPMTKLPRSSTIPVAASRKGSVFSQGQKLTLRALLHYLWDQAELTHWHPGFVGKRSWTTVRKHLLRAAENKVTHGQPLLGNIYIPEAFSVAQREEINARRLRQWVRAKTPLDGPQELMLMVAEVKEIVPARYGYKAVVKHVPDQAFALDEALYRQLCRHFEQELALWWTEDDLHLLMIATFRLDGVGVPRLAGLSLMLATPQWIPVEDEAERRLISTLVKAGRKFIKGLSFGFRSETPSVCATLVDLGATPMPVFAGYPPALPIPPALQTG